MQNLSFQTRSWNFSADTSQWKLVNAAQFPNWENIMQQEANGTLLHKKDTTKVSEKAL